ncbi:MAG TPA: L-seryl-tRNA(Sec) selenium transferase [Deltaproteobacteria bacterium]|nr:L-seryl-tRNA(Sec) selenium transferase [Deltaproteobacteria bacterium]
MSDDGDREHRATSADQSARLRALPKIDRLVRALGDVPHGVAVAAARQVVSDARERVLGGREAGAAPELERRARARAALLQEGRLRAVINATGVVVHTNLGRAPWPASARAAVSRAAGYCDLELELDSGHRGGRLRGLTAQLRELTGAEDALVVNNCAAAVLLGLTALARGREVIVSRGELVEIGGSFRVPDVIASGGASLREVGTTNRTRVADFEAAIGPETAVLLRVHPSNFRIVGFTEGPDRAELVALGHERGLVVLEDLGSGSLDGALGEPSVLDALAAGVDLVFFSGDKLLGGPQAGIVAGRHDTVQQLRRHPLYRALRVDKVILAALEATLGDHLCGRIPPVLQMIHAPGQLLEARAQQLAGALALLGVDAEVIEDVGYVGGGALPGQGLPGSVVRIEPPSPDRIARTLRLGQPPVVVRVVRGGLQLDPRTVAPEQLQPLAERVAAVVTTR